MEEVQLRQVHRPISQLAIVLETEWHSLDRIADSEIAVIGVEEAVVRTDLFTDIKFRFLVTISKLMMLSQILILI